MKNKLKAVLDRNTGFQTIAMITISKTIKSEEASSEYYPEDLSAEDLASFRIAPIT